MVSGMKRLRENAAVLGRSALIGVLALLVADCGGRPPQPKRGVLEQSIGSWTFRRYQQLLDVEVWVPKNPGVAHTASYVHREDLERGQVEEGDVVHAFVTRYREDVGIQRQLARFARRLAKESGYMVEEEKVKGARLLRVTGHGEAWVLWTSERHVIKIGGRAIEKVPKAIIRSYAKRYPSRLLAGILEGPLPPGEDAPRPKEDPYDPTRPTPDWEEWQDEDTDEDEDADDDESDAED
jgi:hypothetical protein